MNTIDYMSKVEEMTYNEKQELETSLRTRLKELSKEVYNDDEFDRIERTFYNSQRTGVFLVNQHLQLSEDLNKLGDFVYSNILEEAEIKRTEGSY